MATRLKRPQAKMTGRVRRSAAKMARRVEPWRAKMARRVEARAAESHLIVKFSIEKQKDGLLLATINDRV
jgi:hypothetical protein